MTEPKPVKPAEEDERKRRAALVKSVHETPVSEDAAKESRSGLRSQGALDTVTTNKAPFVRAYNKAPNLDRPFDAVDMDETGGKDDDPTPLVIGPVIKTEEPERTRMPADNPSSPPTRHQEPRNTVHKEPTQRTPGATQEEGKAVEKVARSKPKRGDGAESAEQPAS